MSPTWRSVLIEIGKVAVSVALAGFAFFLVSELETISVLLRETGKPCIDLFDVIQAIKKSLWAMLPIGLLFYSLPLLVNRLFSNPSRTLRWFGAGGAVALAMTLIWNLIPEPQYGCPVPQTPIADTLIGAFFLLCSAAYWGLSRYGRHLNS